MIQLSTIVSLIFAILSKASIVLKQISSWKWKSRENKKTKEDARRVKKIVKDGMVDEINNIYFNYR